MRNLEVINLNYLVSNAKKIKAKLPNNTKFCAVVKADAYGHGSVVVANTLHPYCDYFAVAIVEEGIELRQGGIDKDILVLCPPLNELDIKRALLYNLTLSVDSSRLLKKVDRISKSLNVVGRVHLVYNTGMNRIGIDNIDRLKYVLRIAKKSESVLIDGFYSHLACPENKKELKLALNKFLLAKKVIKGYNNNVICHISSSGGFLKGAYFDMVRIGILLYGYLPFYSNAIKVKPIMKVYSYTIKSRNISSKSLCLYGDKKTHRNMMVHLVRFGYADGLNRCRIKGQYNNRCMDISAYLGSGEKRICIMDNADILAKKYKTISYEILTKIGIRAEKKYIR